MLESDLIEIIQSKPVVLTRYVIGELLEKYFRLKVRGKNHLCRTGRAIVLPNHSGFAGFDVMVLAHLLKKYLNRTPKIVAHRAYFDLFQTVRIIAEGMGLMKPRFAAVCSELELESLVVLFPEAEAGNFKSSFKRYRLRSFHHGFVRLALLTQAPIIPTIIIGAEESNFNLGNFDLSRFVEHLVIPLPLNFLPLPAKWTIEFLKPIDLSHFSAKKADDHEFVAKLAQDVRLKMQSALNVRLAKRGSIYFGS